MLEWTPISTWIHLQDSSQITQRPKLWIKEGGKENTQEPSHRLILRWPKNLGLMNLKSSIFIEQVLKMKWESCKTIFPYLKIPEAKLERRFRSLAIKPSTTSPKRWISQSMNHRLFHQNSGEERLKPVMRMAWVENSPKLPSSQSPLTFQKLGQESSSKQTLTEILKISTLR